MKKGEPKLKQITKRDGRLVKFNQKKIQLAIKKAGEATGEFDSKEAGRLAEIAVNIIIKGNGKHTPTVEQVQDVVEQVLMRTESSSLSPSVNQLLIGCETRYRSTIRKAPLVMVPMKRVPFLAVRLVPAISLRGVDVTAWSI